MVPFWVWVPKRVWVWAFSADILLFKLSSTSRVLSLDEHAKEASAVQTECIKGCLEEGANKGVKNKPGT